MLLREVATAFRLKDGCEDELIFAFNLEHESQPPFG